MKTATYKYKHRLLHSGILALSLLLLGSCIYDEQMKKGAGIRFNVYTERGDTPETRSSSGIIACTTDSATDTVFLIEHEEPFSDHTGIRTRAEITTSIAAPFSTIGYRGTTSANISTTPWFYNAETNDDGTLVNPVYWEWAYRHARFHAIYPYTANGPADKIRLSPVSYSSTPYVDFEVEPGVRDQKDLMTACSGNVHYATQGVHPRTDLKFRHALTAVRFKVGPNLSLSKTITKVEIINAKSKGRYTLGTDENNTGAAWSNLNTPTSFTLSGISVKLETPKVDVDSLIIGKPGDTLTFYMIPQSLTGVSVKIYFDNNPTPAITANLAGSWIPGTVKTYSLSQTTSDWEYHLNVTSPPAVAYNATSAGDYTIQSYRRDPVSGKDQPVAWEVVSYQESADGGVTWSNPTTTKPAWLTGLSRVQGNGGTTAQTGTATLQAAALRDSLDDYNQALQIATSKGTDGSPYNLSNATGATAVQNTANSYLISAPGYYCIPLVYGNAIKNGNDNPSAYRTANTGTRILQRFKDHRGVNITSPYINVQNPDPATQASIVWTDQSDIVTNLSISGSDTSTFVRFRVPQENIKNGNAVIAVKNASGTVMWSWHLWFAKSDELRTIACTNYQGHTYNFTKQTLGFAWRTWLETSYKKPRVARLKVEQTVANGGEKKFAYIDITQKNGSIKEFSSTLYQWGRKDAMPGVQTVSNGSFLSNDTDDMSIQNGIQHPELLYIKAITWYTGYPYDNLWSMNNTTTGFNDNPVVKTVYDPCPVGFHMPASNAFTGFSTTGIETTNQTELNVSGDWDMGWNFKAGGSSTKTVYFPATGYRNNFDGSVSYVGSHGRYWSAVPYDTQNCCYLLFLSYVSPKVYNARMLAYSARPVSDSQSASAWQYHLNVTSPEAVAYNTTSTGNYTIQSYREDAVSGTQQPVAWEVVSYQESADGGVTWSNPTTTKPAWLTALSLMQGNGGTTAQTGTATLQAAALRDSLNDYNLALKFAPKKGDSGDYYDLSTHDVNGNSTPRNTANSYLISAPGWYRIPLVYGNAITNGSANPSAYQTANTGTNILQRFKDHAGADITSPYINVQNASNPATQASIVWTDQSDIVTNLLIAGSGTGASVYFHVPQSNLRNGNAVIAVKNASGTVMWSWHLWFAKSEELRTIACTNYQGHTYNFTKQTLGFA